jgi:hypothetical protein
MIAKNANNETPSPFSVKIEGDKLIVAWGENILHIDTSTFLTAHNLTPTFVDDLLSRWLVDDWQSLPEWESNLLNELLSSAKLDIKIAGSHNFSTITGADVIKLLTEMKII